MKPLRITLAAILRELKEEHKMRPLICIIGRTGSGKSTLADDLCTTFNLKSVQSYTTRPMRPGEEKKSDHLFITPDAVEKYKNQMAAYTKIGEAEYFTTYDVLEKSDVYVIDPIGVGALRKKVKDRPIYTIYIQTDMRASEEHLDARADEQDTRNARIAAEKAQFDAYEALEPWDFIVENNSDLRSAQLRMHAAYRTIRDRCELYELWKRYDAEQIKALFKEPWCELEFDFMGFEDVYRGAAEIISSTMPGKTVIDFGCYAGAQAIYFRNQPRYIGVDISKIKKFKTENSEYFETTIQEFVRNVWPALKIGAEDCIAICSYVPDKKAVELVRQTFPNVIAVYP